MSPSVEAGAAMVRRVVAAALAGIAILATMLRASAGAGPEPVEIRHGDDLLKAELYRPDGAGPFPAVIGLHGCEGLRAANGQTAVFYRDWAERLNKAGFVVLYPDSYGSRELGAPCRNRAVLLRTNRERIGDAIAAREWLQSRSFIKADRISLVGWSSGAVSVLWAVRPSAGAHDGKPDFRSAVALYPGCTRLEITAWSTRIPTLILAAGADDWSSAKACEQMVAGARGRSARATIVVYPGAYHDFDHPNRPVQVRTGYAFSVDNSGKVHTGTNAAARADAIKRVTQFLSRGLGPTFSEQHSEREASSP
jgi:dienelactone hydrolase